MNLERELNNARRDIRLGIAIVILAPLSELLMTLALWCFL